MANWDEFVKHIEQIHGIEQDLADQRDARRETHIEQIDKQTRSTAHQAMAFKAQEMALEAQRDLATEKQADKMITLNAQRGTQNALDHLVGLAEGNFRG